MKESLAFFFWLIIYTSVTHVYSHLTIKVQIAAAELDFKIKV
jgi:hypothetical protein